MSFVRPEDQVIALLVSDLHLSHQKPSIRAEPDWYSVQKAYLKQLEDLRPAWDVPIICGGDVFDKAVANSELINFCIDNMPEMYAVPGQHDLKYHSWEEWEKTAFCTMAKVGKLKMLSEHHPTQLAWQNFPNPMQLMVYGYGWGKEVHPPIPCLAAHPRDDGFPTINLAVCHRYVWIPGKSYPDAPKQGRLGKVQKEFKGYDAVLFGDNHCGWIQGGSASGECGDGSTFFNPGSFMRRKSDEIYHKPCVGFLKADGSIERRFLDCSGDRFVDRPEEAESKELNLDGFVEGLKEIGSRLDFESACKRAADGLSEGARKILLEALEK